MLSTAIGGRPTRVESARRRANWTVLAMAGCMVALFSACASTIESISVEQFPVEPTPSGNEYTIGVGDLLNVQVYDQPQFSGTVRVRTDGRITITLVGELVAAGTTPLSLQG